MSSKKGRRQKAVCGCCGRKYRRTYPLHDRYCPDCIEQITDELFCRVEDFQPMRLENLQPVRDEGDTDGEVYFDADAALRRLLE